MMKVLTTFLLTIICFIGYGQQSDYVFGFVTDSITELPVQDAHVAVVGGDTADYTNSSGLFVIKGQPGDSISIVRVGYFEARIALQGVVMALDTMHIILKPKTHELESVIVSAYDYEDYQADSIDRTQFFEATIGYALPLFDRANTGAGLGISLDRIFGHKQRNKKRALRLFNSVEEQKYVDFRFNPILVHSYTGFKGDSLQQFMNKYSPSYRWLRSHETQEDILYYINDQLKKHYHRGR